MEHDRPADLQRRTIVGPLVGYEFYESTAMNLDVAGGPLYVNEEFYAADNRDYLALGWTVDFDRFLIPDRMQFYHLNKGLLEPGDTDNLVVDAWTGFRFPIYAGIVASTEVLIEYDGGAPDGVDNTDTTYNLKLGDVAMEYLQRILNLDSTREWYADALSETWRDLNHDRETLAAGRLIEDLRNTV